MTNNVAEQISVMIIETFPNEAKDTYYIPPIKKKNSVRNKSIPSCGKLMTMWRNKQHKRKILDKKMMEETLQHEIISVEDNGIYLHICNICKISYLYVIDMLIFTILSIIT